MATQTESLVVSVSEKGALVVKRNLEGIGGGARKAEGSVKLLRTALGALVGVAGLAGAVMVFKGAVNTMAKFSQEMSTVGAISGATQTQMEDLRDTAKDLGITTRFSASQAAEGMTFLARAGFNTNEVLAAIGPTLQLAQAGALGLGEAADIASNVLTGFNIAARESARVIDVLALAANSSNTNVQQLGEAMSYVAPISASLGVSLEETAAAVEVLSNAGIQASRAGTNLTMVMRLLQSPTEKQNAVLADLGLTAQDVSVANLGLTKVLENLLNAGIEAPQVFEFFGRSAATASVLLRGASGEIQNFTRANEEAQGTAKNVAETMDKNLNGALIAVKSAWEGLILAFGDLGTENALTKFFRDLAGAIRFTAENLDILVKLVGSLGTAIGGVALSGFLQGLTSGAPAALKLAGGVKAVGTALSGLALSPVAAGLVAVAAGAAAVNFWFDQVRKTQDAMADAEEAEYKVKLFLAQTQVKEIQDRKKAEQSLKDYIKSLDDANEALKHGNVAQEDTVDLLRAMEIARRPLTKGEIEDITAKHEARKAIEAKNKTIEDENALLAELQQPMKDYAEREKLLNSLRAQGRISQATLNDEIKKMQEALGMNVDPNAGYDEYIKNLKREVDLLGMSNKEREVAKALDSARATLPEGQDLTPDQTQDITDLTRKKQLQEELNATEERKQELLRSLIEPEQLHKESMQLLNQSYLEGSINLEEYNRGLANLGAATTEAASMTAELADGALGSLWDNAASALDSFVDTGIFKFKDFARSIISDITKIAAKMLLLQAFKGLGIPIPGFATGGSFMVGGQGGTDSQLVAFNASPNERVDVLTPAQQAAKDQGQQAAAAGPINMTIINVVDPSEVPAIMASEAGQKVTLNTISLNGSEVRQAIA